MDKKEQIIKTAIKLFVKQGFENTPTSQISKESKVATGTLFHHFKTKEELINEAYLYCKVKMMDETSPRYVGKTIQEQVKNSWVAGMEWCLDNTVIVDFFNLFSNSVYITKLTRDQGAESFEPFTKIISKGAKQGLFKKIPEEILLQTYYGVFNAFFRKIRESKKLDRKLVLAGFDTVWDALRR